MKLHREGYNTIIYTILLLLALNATVFFLLPAPPWLMFSVWGGSLIVILIVMRFFRVPRRARVSNDQYVLSSADGKVVVVEETNGHKFCEGPCIQLSVFMSVHNVHFNLYPVSGTVEKSEYFPGKFLVARNPKASMLNESMTVLMRNAEGEKIVIRQIAGIMARRVVCYARAGMRVKQSDEMGFIKFGSRVDLLLPAGSKVLVKPGDKVRCGITPLAVLPSKQG